MEDQLTAVQMAGNTNGAQAAQPNGAQTAVEFKPHFHEWATVQPGMICLARKKKTAVFRQYVAAETAVPVIACAACLPKNREKDYFFAGVARTKSVRGPDDGIGPSVDEFFTLSIGGMVTVLNTSGAPLHVGDLIEWTFISPKAANPGPGGVQKRQKTGPRRVGIKMATVSSPKVIGRALSFAKSGETIDILLCAQTHAPQATSPLFAPYRGVPWVAGSSKQPRPQANKKCTKHVHALLRPRARSGITVSQYHSSAVK